MRNKLFLIVCLLIAALLVGRVYQLRRGAQTGRTVYFEIQPVDPRALLMGDYMVLSYPFERGAPPQDATLYIGADQKATLNVSSSPVSVRYFGSRFQIPHIFYFKEGTAHRYAKAKYVKMSLLPSGRLLALALADENLNSL